VHAGSERQAESNRSGELGERDEARTGFSWSGAARGSGGAIDQALID
jgi:hypothetical protein